MFSKTSYNKISYTIDDAFWNRFRDCVVQEGMKPFVGGQIHEIWTGSTAAFSTGGLACMVPAHGVKVFCY